MRISKLYMPAALAVGALALAGCGGGSGSATPTVVQPTGGPGKLTIKPGGKSTHAGIEYSCDEDRTEDCEITISSAGVVTLGEGATSKDTAAEASRKAIQDLYTELDDDTGAYAARHTGAGVANSDFDEDDDKAVKGALGDFNTVMHDGVMRVDNRGSKSEEVTWAERYITDGEDNVRSDHGVVLGSDTAKRHVIEFGGASYEHIAGSDFQPSGTTGNKNHRKDIPDGTTIKVSGSFGGFPGTYQCAAEECNSRRDSDDHIVLATAQWDFIPNGTDDDDIKITVDVPDGEYIQFGWWKDEDEDGAIDDITTFIAAAGTAAPVAGGVHVLTQKATYEGKAVGQAVLSTGASSDVAGAFTADVSLTADFDASDPATPGASDTNGAISGTIDGFVVDGKSRSGWSVELKAQALANDNGTFGSDSGTGMTVWTIGDDDAPPSGNYHGGLRDDGDDGVPSVAVGQFSSAYRNTGRMVGAFGAER